MILEPKTDVKIRDRLKVLDWVNYIEPIVIEQLGCIDIIPNFAEYIPEGEYIYHGEAWDIAFNWDMVLDLEDLIGLVGIERIEITDYVVTAPSTPLIGPYVVILFEGEPAEIWQCEDRAIMCDSRFYNIY